MNNVTKALCWAGAMVFVATGAKFGFMSREAAETMLVVLPILAVTTFRAKPCRLKAAL